MTSPASSSDLYNRASGLLNIIIMIMSVLKTDDMTMNRVHPSEASSFVTPPRDPVAVLIVFREVDSIVQ